MHAVSPSLHRALRVLIVEDESRLRDLLLDVIPDMGFAATAARTAEDAKRVMEVDPHEIVLLDLRLPDMCGMDFFEFVHGHWPDTQVIILTGFGDLEAAKQAIHLDVVDFLSKPCHLKNVEMALERARRRIWPPGEMPSLDIERPVQVAVVKDSPATLRQSERQHILAALSRNDGNRTAAAAELGISRRMLHYRLSEYQQQGHLID
jgi:DNA-binding NtrC family response regulator